MVACLEEIAYRMGYITRRGARASRTRRWERARTASTCSGCSSRRPDVRFVPTDIPAVIVVEPDVHRDSARLLSRDLPRRPKYRDGGIDGPFVQDNHSRSAGGTLRGLHLQLPASPGQADSRRSRARSATSPSTSARLADVRPMGRRHAVGRRTSASATSRQASRTASACVSPIGADRIQVHRRLRSVERNRHRVERSGAWRSPGLSTQPILSDRDRGNPRGSPDSLPNACRR